MTTGATPTTTPAVEPSILAFDTEVMATAFLSPSYKRITLGSESLAALYDGGPLGTRDLRVKLVFADIPHLPELSPGWYRRWLAVNPQMHDRVRTYTVRAASVRGATIPQIDIDFFLHDTDDGRGGPGSSWALGASPGDRVTVIGRSARRHGCGGIEWHPPHLSSARLLLVGDQSAVPAICSILETLPAHHHGHALLEVPASDDFLDVRTHSGIEVIWHARQRRPHGATIRDTLRALFSDGGTNRSAQPEYIREEADELWEATDARVDVQQEFYGWVAGETSTVRLIRRDLLDDVGLAKGSVAFMGYWRRTLSPLGEPPIDRTRTVANQAPPIAGTAARPSR